MSMNAAHPPSLNASTLFFEQFDLVDETPEEDDGRLAMSSLSHVGCRSLVTLG